jgi:CubicO group peptidase (beta-lactamase class C family)
MDNSRRTFLKNLTLLMAAPARADVKDSPSPAELAAMHRVASAFMTAHSIPGLSVAIACKGELVYEQGFGFADQDKGEKVTPSHLFRIASVSKPITSVTVFDLIEQERLGLEDVVFGPGGLLRGDFGNPPYKQYVGAIRLKHLLTHTAGGWTNDNTDPMFRNPAMDHKQLIAWTLANVPLTHPPGEHYAYSNFGYCVVGRIIEKVTGQPYGVHVRDAILRKCGISDMRIGGNTLAERAPAEVVYYGAGGQNPYNMNVRRMDSHGGWLATASDLVRFAIRVDGFPQAPDILKAASIREMTTPTSANPQYAKGWAVNSVPNWWHTGSLPGTTSIMVRTASGFCWAALANSREAGGDTGGAMDKMMWDMVRQVKSWNA